MFLEERKVSHVLSICSFDSFILNAICIPNQQRNFTFIFMMGKFTPFNLNFCLKSRMINQSTLWLLSEAEWRRFSNILQLRNIFLTYLAYLLQAHMHVLLSDYLLKAQLSGFIYEEMYCIFFEGNCKASYIYRPKLYTNQALKSNCVRKI